MSELDPDGPAVVALGGGHGLAAALRGIRQYASSITAIVSVADDGGSSGRLRRDLGVLPPGDLRRCLVALADDELWADAFEYRFAAGELDGHALGNLVLVGLTDTTGDFTAALDAAGRLLGAVGRVLPATTEPVVLKAEVGDHEVEGQVAVQNSSNIGRVGLVPADAGASPEAMRRDPAGRSGGPCAGFALHQPAAGAVCRWAPGAVATTSAQVIQVANLRPQPPETTGLDATDHLRVLRAHGVRVDVFLYQEAGELAADDDQIRAWGAEPVAASVATDRGYTHDPRRLAQALRALL